MPLLRAPKVTIGLPVRNGERYLALALDSIIGQTFDDIDVIVSDNASTDSTIAITREYMARDKRVHLIQSDKNVGVAENFNRCFRGTKSPYFRWAAYDDIMDADYLRRCVDVLDNIPDVCIAHTYSTRIDEFGRHKGTDTPVPYSQSKVISERFYGAACKREVDGVWGLMRSDIISRTRLHGKYSGSDFAFLADMYLYGRLQYVPEYLFHIREHPAAYTGRGATMSFKEKWEWWGQTGLLKNKYLHAPLLISYEADALLRSDIDWDDKLACWRHVLENSADYFRGINARWINRVKAMLPKPEAKRVQEHAKPMTTSVTR